MGNIKVRIFKKVRCVHSIGTGNITFKYLINRIVEVHDHQDFDLSFNIFADYGDAVISFEDEDFESYNSFFRELQKSNVRRKMAIYTNNEITFKTANMNHLLVPGAIEVDVFQNREMALAFLGITDEDLADY